MSWNFLNEKKEMEWDEFISKQEESKFVHLIGFKRTIEKIYKFEPFYLYYEKGKEILAIFSSFIQDTVLTGKKIVSQPFSGYGGFIISNSLVDNEKISILEELFYILRNTLEKRKIRGIELRGKTDRLMERFFKKSVLGKYGIKKLEGSLDLWNSVDYMVRKAVNKAKREGVKIFEDLSFDRIKDFYFLHLITMKRLGSPPHPYSYFYWLRKELLKNIKIFFAVYEDRVISALLGWKIGKNVHITDNPSDKNFFHLRGNDYLHYTFLEWAKENGYKTFDFGPMSYEGQEFYKRKWNLDTFEYSIFHYPEKTSSLPYNPPFYVKMASKIWKLVPTWFSRYTGKFLRRELGL